MDNPQINTPMKKGTFMKMVKRIFITGIVLILIAVIGWIFIPNDFINKVKRKEVEFVSGNWAVTVVMYNTVFEYEIKDDKITCVPDKGYYYFWGTDKKTGERVYAQPPIGSTFPRRLK